MSITGALSSAGFKPEKSTVGDKPILEGVYKALFTDWSVMEDKGYGPSIYAAFKVTETLAGNESRSTFPEFKGYFNTSPEKVNSKRNGLAKLLNGFFSVEKSVDTSSDEALSNALNSMKGSTEVYIKAYEDFKNVKQADGSWVKDKEGDRFQGWSFMTAKNAAKEAEKLKTKATSPF